MGHQQVGRSGETLSHPSHIRTHLQNLQFQPFSTLKMQKKKNAKKKKNHQHQHKRIIDSILIEFRNSPGKNSIGAR